jgi:hypothetical protein
MLSIPVCLPLAPFDAGPVLTLTSLAPLEPTTGSDEEGYELSRKDARFWENLNRFWARCWAAGVFDTGQQAIAAFREALEEDLTTTSQKPDMARAIAECRIMVASAWVQHAHMPMLRWPLPNIDPAGFDKDETSEPIFRNGALYSGPCVVCQQRWDFWLNRFRELEKDTSLGLSDHVRRAAGEAAQNMTALGAGMSEMGVV